jgi:hypothetical protein
MTMSDFEDGSRKQADDSHELPGIGQLPTERTTFHVDEGFTTLPPVLRDDLICCCEGCTDEVQSVLWVPHIDEEPRPESTLQLVNGKEVGVGAGCVMELSWKDGTFYFLNS